MTVRINEQLAAAFCEQIYRRDSKEQQLVSDIKNDGFKDMPGLSGAIEIRKDLDLGGSNLTQFNRDGFYYNLSNGFVGQVIQANGKIFVVLRGSDLSASFGSALKPLLFADPAGPVQAPGTSSTVDQRDWANNRILGSGTAARTQLEGQRILLSLQFATPLHHRSSFADCMSPRLT